MDRNIRIEAIHRRLRLIALFLLYLTLVTATVIAEWFWSESTNFERIQVLVYIVALLAMLLVSRRAKHS